MIRAAAFALGILLIAPAGGALAQPAATPPSAEPAPAAEPEPAEAAIGVPEVIGRATEAERELREIAASAEPLDAIVKITDGIPAVSEALAGRVAQAAERIETSTSIRILADVEAAWQLEMANFEAWNGVLTERIHVLEEKLTRLGEIEALWQKTQKDLLESGAPVVRERIKATLSDLATPRRKVTARRDELIDHQAEIAALIAEVADVSELTAKAKQEIQSGLLGTDAPPLWTALLQGPIDQVIREREIRGLTQAFEAARIFTLQQRQRIALHVLSVVVAVILLLALRRLAARRPEEDASFRASAVILERPYSCAVLIGYALTLVIHPNAPNLVYSALAVVALVPIIRLIPQLLDPTARATFYALVAFFVLDTVRGILAPLILLERLVYLLELVAAIVVFGRLLHPSRYAAITDRTRLMPFTGTAIRLGIGLLIAAAVAEIAGSTALAQILGEGVLDSAYFAVAAYALYRVLEGVVGVTLRSDAAQKLNMVREHSALFLRRTLRLLRFAALLGWFSFTLGRFDIRDDVLDALGAGLGAHLSIGELSISLGGVLTFALTFTVALYFSRMLRFVLDQDVLPRMQLPRGVPYAVTASLHYVIVFLGLLAAVAAAGVDLSEFSIMAGALGVGIGFGLQNVVNNFVSGLILLFERPIQTDDVVEVGPLLGAVRRIGIRSSTVRTFDGAEVIVPNANLISDQVVNWTLSDRQRRIEIKVGVKYGSDPERVQALLLQVAAADTRILEQPEPDALFMSFGDSSLDFEMRCWTGHYAQWMQIRSDLNVAVNRALHEAGIEIPFPQRDLHLRSVSQDVGAALKASGDGD